MSPEDSNLETFSSRRIMRRYARLGDLFTSERVILEKLRARIGDRKLLEIGVGGGRMTRALLDLSSDYTAIDYSPAAIEATRRRFSLDSIYQCDMRDMRRFRCGTFDFAICAYNGLDYVDHEGRLKALSEIHRVLKPGAVFMFSTHNLNFRYAGMPPWRWRDRSLREFAGSLIFYPRHLLMKRHEVRAQNYAILNDLVHRYSILTYYISPLDQIKQLKSSAFRHVNVYDAQGEPRGADESQMFAYYTALNG